MDKDETFEADTDIALARSRSQIRSLSQSHSAFTATHAAIDPLDHQPEENDPLLKRTKSKTYVAPPDVENGNGNFGGAPEWAEDRDFEGLPWWRTPSVYWLLPAFALFTIAFGGTIVPKINLILSLICREYFSERSMQDPTFHMMPVVQGEENLQCQIPEVQSLVSKFTLYGGLISGILSAIISPKLGALSDRYGRTKMIAVTTMGMLMAETIFIIVATYPDLLSVNWILFGYFFDGLGGSFIAAMALSYAYASDCTAPEKRNVVFGYYHGCLFGGIALGPLFAAYVVKATGEILSIFYIAIACHCTFFLFLLFVVPESLSKERQRAAREKEEFKRNAEQHRPSGFSHTVSLAKSLFKGANVLAPLTILWPTEPGINPAVRRNLFFLAAVDTTMFGVAMGSMTIIVIYSEYMFGWGNFETSIFVSIVNACRVAVLVVLLPGITRLLRGPQSKSTQPSSGCDQIDLGIIRLAIFFDLMGYVGYATVRTGPLFIACGAIAAIGGMGSPTLQSALTKHVPADRTGQVLGAMGLLHASARVIAPTIFNLLYAQTVGKFTQTVFVCLAATFGLAFGFAWCVRPHVYWEETIKSEDDDGDAADEVNTREGD
ncbi:MAG: hypothetical protein Q9217_001476 [Psora testacea]